MSKYELDDAAYEALKAHPVMVEEAMTNQDGAFWAKFSYLYQASDHSTIATMFGDAIDSYVKEQVEYMASDDDMTENAAISILLRRCNGGK